ncbi:UNVERIFIED_ORG: TolC family protein (plasmid) [Shinella sp. XGS7]|jgi:cobalt-zinc-cadmium efflux system outer membrane protein|nr:TolC family protein [Shinella sp. XGS7]
MYFSFRTLSRAFSVDARSRAPIAPLCALLLALSMASTGVTAQAPAVTTLRQAFEAAWLRQPEAASADLHRQAAQGRKVAAQSWTVEPPSLEVSAKTDRLNRNEGSRELEFGVAVPLWLPGERSRSLALAEAEAGAVDSRTTAAQWRLAGTLRDAWWSLHRARVEVGLARARQDSAAQLARDVARRVTAGELAKADQHQADGALAAAQAELAASQASQTQAEQALRALTAEVPAPALLDAPEAVPAMPTDETEPVSTHPALRELSDRVLMAERARDLAGVQQRANPELTLATTRDRGAFGDRYGQTVTLGLRFPFGSSGANQAKRATAGAELIEAQAQLTLERQRLSGELAGARARLLASQAAAEAATRRSVLARDTRGFVEKSFRAGETDLPSRLRVELEAFEAERQATLARLNVNQAISAFNQALGLLPQ